MFAWNIKTPARQAPKLSVENLFKSYLIRDSQHLTVLENVNLEIFPREFICLVGASGCGKSTLLNIIAGLTPPSSGEVLVDGRSVTGKPGSDRGMVFQGYTLYPWLTVAQNIAFGLQFQRMSKSHIANWISSSRLSLSPSNGRCFSSCVRSKEMTTKQVGAGLPHNGLRMGCT
nr:ATP-binding cassette domain-containing protein [Chamaesiphon sp. GL140_3_metabinner_50]